MLYRLFHARRFVPISLLFAFLLRVGVILIFYISLDLHGGDASFYIHVSQHPELLWFPEPPHTAVTSIGPGYPIFLSLFSANSDLMMLVAARLGQASLDTLTAFFIYRITRELFTETIGRVTLLIQVLDPRYLFINGSIATEVLFICLFTGFILAYLRAHKSHSVYRWGIAGGLLGLSVLTRPVPILFAIPIVGHLWLTYSKDYRRGAISWFGAAMLLIIAPWFIRTGLATGEFIPGADTAFSHFWLASQDEGRDLNGGAFYDEKVDTFSEDDNNLEVSGTDYFSSGIGKVLGSPMAWIGRTLTDTIKAYAQPYGTVYLINSDSPGLRSLVGGLFTGQTSPAELFAAPGLFRRIMMYLFHFWGIGFGIVGVWFVWKEKHIIESLPLLLWIGYTTAVTALLLIEPRYLFPTMFAFTILATYGSIQLFEALRPRQNPEVA